MIVRIYPPTLVWKELSHWPELIKRRIMLSGFRNLGISTTSKGAFCHDLADPLNSMFKTADPFSASATFLYRPEHFLAVSFFLEIYTPCRKKTNVELL